MRTALSALALWLGLIGAGASWPGLAAAQDEVDGAEAPPDTSVQVADWVVASGDNRGLPFMIIDKVAALVLVYSADGEFRGVAPALLGSARGDDSAPGVGDRELSGIPPEERTTPAGRFLAGFGPAVGGKHVLWVDYATAVSLHPVVTASRKEKRLKRLQSPSPEDNRITFGCINVSPAFYKDVVRPAFSGTNGVVYILPEATPLDQALPSFQPRPAVTSARADHLDSDDAPERALAPQ